MFVYRSLGLLLLTIAAPAWAAPPRVDESLDFDWRFQLGDPDAAAPDFDDRAWRTLDVPHDWSIEGEYREDHPAGMAGGFLPTGVGWYRKHLPWREAWEGKRVLLRFDGVYMNSDVWVNGRHVGRRPYGYASFWYDVTEHLHSGDNVIAVRVDNSRAPSGRWYTGSGIYRHVWLRVVDPIHVPVWGVSTSAADVSPESATLRVVTEVTNGSTRDESAAVDVTVLAPDGTTVAEASAERTVAAGETGEVAQRLRIEAPRLWSPDSPSLYTIVSTVRVDGVVRDRVETVTGVRAIEFTVDRGFLLNGEPVELRGACMHHDGGPVGAAVPNDVLRRRLRLLKRMGANAVRTSHNPFAPEFYAMTDELGLMVLDEAFDGWFQPKAEHDYGNYFEEWWRRDLGDFIRRDRNHPSVVLWSIGNEVRGWKPPDQKLLVEFIKELDPTRPVTQGEGARGGHLDVAGFNGHGEYRGAIEAFHKKRPDLPIVGTEITHTAQTRGVYRSKTSYRTRDNPAPWERRGPGAAKKWAKIKNRIHRVDDLTEEEVFPGVTKRYQSSYDNSFVRMNVREEIRLADRLPYFVGTFRWTAFDYLGESFNWPARTANFGILDLAGFPKDHYYLYQSRWSDEPMIHVLPHWTHPGKEGVEIPVVVYTNQESAELRLNGESLGEKPMTDAMQIVWLTPYRAGELEALGKTGGEVRARASVRTAGEAHAVSLSIDRTRFVANRQDVAHVEVTVVDREGVPLPDADHPIDFTVTGPGRLIGVENGDILDLSPHKVSHRRLFKGKCLALVQATADSGVVEITASSDGLRSAEASIESQAE